MCKCFCFSCLNIIIVIQLGYTYVNDGDGNLSQRMMTMKNLLQRARKTIKIKNMLFLTIAGIINAFGITIFLNPVNLYDSGISGTAMLAAQLTPESLSLSKAGKEVYILRNLYGCSLFVRFMADNRCSAR